MPSLLVVAVLAATLAGARAIPVDIDPSRCVQDFALYQWEVQRFGPIIVCSGGTVTFRWRALHGVFQIPTIACPSNFTAQEAGNYAFLSPVSQGGGYVWELPKETGHYWATSQQGQDCYNGMIAEVYVVNPEDAPFRSAASRAALTVGAALAAALAALAALA